MRAGMHNKSWFIHPARAESLSLADELKIPPVLAQVLVNRGVATAEQAKSFLNPKLTELIEPDVMPGVPAATEEICRAIASRQKITIYGDYDVDGITAAAILWHIIRLLGSPAEFYIPHRIDEGYGLNDGAVRQIAADGTKLLITVDCGITAADSVRLARQLGMDVIITDHHTIEPTLPDANVIVHPMLGDYANPKCAGATVAFKLAWALTNRFKSAGRTNPKLREFLINATVFAALGTIADVIELRGENRIIASFGLKAMHDCSMPGLAALINAAGLEGQKLDSYHIGFILAPMLNAAGRMGHARLAVELLTTDSQVRALRIADYLKQQNYQRQSAERKIFQQVCEVITQAGLDHPDRRTIVLGSEQWHTGIVGIVAAKVVDKFYKPTILINTENGLGKGSARSIEGFDIYGAISACSKYVVKFGGHSMAAGITLEPAKIGEFADAFEKYAAENFRQTASTAKIEIDAICPIRDISYNLVRQLEPLGPFGRGNPKPLIATRGVRLIASPRKVGSRGEHLQLAIGDSTGSARCIGFKMAGLEKKLLENEFFNVAYEPQLDTWNGGDNLQFVLSDISFE